ncbi:30S ribosomal protein S24e [Candidatus Woesearchaeota archaeon]|nr:30S ribosomal protein S24e [Candidatus Woesearchaeota archaeon]
MELKIIEKKENPLLHRIELEAELTATGPTPSNEAVIKALASQLKAEEKMIIIKHIYSRFGTNVSDVLAFLYDNEEKMKEIEYIKETKKEAKPAEAPKAEEKKE